MQYTHLGRTGLVVSRLCLGTMVFGPIRSEQESHAMLDKALELGINFVDTSNIYGSKVFEGEAEQIIGNWLAQGGGRREQIALTTKVFGPMGQGVNQRGLSAYHIRKACEDSLRRLKTDHIDVYFMHHIDRGAPTAGDKLAWGLPDWQVVDPPQRKKETPWEEIWQAMELLVQQGKVLYVGSSNFAAWNIVQACEKAAARSFMGLVCEQSIYNLSNRTIELEVIPACREYGLGLLAWSPLAAGLLAGKLPTGESGRREDLSEKTLQTHHNQMEAYEALCRELNETPADVAIAWLLRNPLTIPIIGPRNMAQLTGSMHTLDIHLADETLRRLDEIWPGPGGEAPEAYAW